MRETQSAKHVYDCQNDQHRSDDSDASSRTPSPISVIASAPAEQKQQNNN